MNDMKIFENSEFGAVRVVEVNGEPWFVAKDVTRALGYAEESNPSRVLQSVPEEWKGGESDSHPRRDARNAHHLRAAEVVEFIRQCVRIATPLLREAPGLLKADDKRIAEKCGKFGKFLVLLEEI